MDDKFEEICQRFRDELVENYGDYVRFSIIVLAKQEFDKVYDFAHSIVYSQLEKDEFFNLLENFIERKKGIDFEE